jgi:hypothetical protein
MTRRGKRTAAFAAIVGAVNLLTAPCRAAGPYSAAPLDLSRLVFAPSAVTGAAPATVAREPAGHSEPPDAGARPTESARTRRSIAEELDAIKAEEVRDGIFAPDLADELVALAGLYQESGEHDAALGVLERARQVVRVNEGLFSLDQARMIQQAIASREALEQQSKAVEAQTELLALARRNPSDARVAEIYAAVAESHVEDVKRFLSGDWSVPFNASFTFGDSVHGPDLPLATQYAWHSVTAAQRNYAEAIRAVVRNRSLDGPSLDDLESGLISTYYLQEQNLRLFVPNRAATNLVRGNLHNLGANSYQRRLQYSALFERPKSEIASEQLALGDWHLVFGEQELAYAAYGSARATLEESGATPEQIEAFFTPSTPVVLPTFAAGYVGTNESADYKGHVDVVIALDGAGRCTRVDVTERSLAATDAVVQRLKKLVAKSVFRPRFESGAWLAESHAALRYYFTY